MLFRSGCDQASTSPSTLMAFSSPYPQYHPLLQCECDLAQPRRLLLMKHLPSLPSLSLSQGSPDTLKEFFLSRFLTRQKRSNIHVCLLLPSNIKTSHPFYPHWDPEQMETTPWEAEGATSSLRKDRPSHLASSLLCRSQRSEDGTLQVFMLLGLYPLCDYVLLHDPSQREFIHQCV